MDVMVVLGERKYTVKALPVGASKRWREAFAQEIEGLLGAVQYAGEAMSKQIGSGGELGQLVAGLGGALASSVGPTLLGAPDRMLLMVYAYAPQIGADHEYIEEQAYDEQVMAAFVEVVKLAYPFGGLLALVRTGQASQATKKN